MADIEHLLAGYHRFFNKHFIGDSPSYAKLANGQSPKTLVIACSDSRVDPSILMEAQAGDIFVIRNVANLIPPYQPDSGTYHGTSAALEFAVTKLLVENIVVMGHSGCAGVEALLNPQDYDVPDGEKHSFVSHWVGIGYLARDRAVLNYQKNHKDHTDGKTLNCLCEREIIRTSLDNLLSFPWIQRQVTANNLTLHGWHFDLKSGELSVLNEKTERFEVVKP